MFALYAPALAFINDQEAIGGGDFEEAVDEALKEAVINLKWSKNARSRLLFMILDAPPHKNPEVIKNLHYSIEIAAEKGLGLFQSLQVVLLEKMVLISNT